MMQPGSPSDFVNAQVFVSVPVSVTRKRACFGFAARAEPLAQTSTTTTARKTPNLPCVHRVAIVSTIPNKGKFRPVRFVEYC